MTVGALKQNAPMLATAGVFFLIYAAASARYNGFFTARVFVNFLADNAFLGVAAVGMTFVILSKGIDLSVGSMVGLTSIVIASLVTRAHWHPGLAIVFALAGGGLLGSAMGMLIRYYALPPFLVTLAGMFFARGLGFVISVESIPITHQSVARLSEFRLPLLGGMSLPLTAVVFLAVATAAIAVSRWTKFGRAVYAIGGNEEAAGLMGLPVGATKLKVYALSGFCSALAGVIYALYSLSGNANAGVGLELDAIAAVVIGGTLLSGGVGNVFGTVIGVLIFGVIQTAITFEGTLSSWWTKIFVGTLLFGFIALQRALVGGTGERT